MSELDNSNKIENKFKIKQINTYGFVLVRQQGAYKEYINYDLDVIVVDVVSDKHNVIFNSLNAAQSVLQTYNSKQLLNEVRSNDKRPLAIKSVKFKYNVNKEGSEEMNGVSDDAS